MSEAATKSREDLLLWMDVLDAYARDWDVTFEHRASYFTQEFWYLLVNCLINSWKGTPLSISRAWKGRASFSMSSAIFCRNSGLRIPREVDIVDEHRGS